VAFAQDKPTFEVASIRPSSPTAAGMWIHRDPGMVTITNFTLKELITQAWNVRPFQVLGGPPWLDSAHFDVSAKHQRVVKLETHFLMLQALLADRFQLAMHRETRELPIYALVLAKKDGKLGPGLVHPKPGNCVYAAAPGDPAKLFCSTVSIGESSLRMYGFPVAELARNLSQILGHQVIDETGLTGNFTINLEWTPDESRRPLR
jgi:uncharacterized protein (TIGR03435 family)